MEPKVTVSPPQASMSGPPLPRTGSLKSVPGRGLVAELVGGRT